MKDIITEALNALEEKAIEDEEESVIFTIADLQESGYLTGDDGLVVELTDGRKFIITIQEEA